MGTHKLIIFATNTEEEKHKTINTTGLTDPNLSWKAKGMHTYIRTNGDNWLQNQEALVGVSTDGRDAVRAGVRELVERKYLHKTTVKNEQGRIKYHAYISLPTPMDLSPDDVLAIVQGHMVPTPQTGLPAPGNPLDKTQTPGEYNRNLHYPSGNITYFFKNKPSYPSGKLTLFCTPGGRTALTLVEFWNSLPNLPTHKLTQPYTKIIKRCEKILTSQLKHNAPTSIKQAMQNYNDLLTSENTTINATTVKKHGGVFRVSLDEFFGWKPKSREIISSRKSHPLYPVRDISWFQICRGKGPAPATLEQTKEQFAQMRKDKHPKLTQLLGDMWSEIIPYDGTPIERNNIRFATERLLEFYNQTKDQQTNPLNARAASSLLPWLKQYLESKIAQGKQLHTGWLISDLTWHEFKNYLYEMAVLQNRRMVGRE